ncbi:MAG: hypothetical protein RR413_03120 [Christensenellaceae bacterium]
MLQDTNRLVGDSLCFQVKMGIVFIASMNYSLRPSGRISIQYPSGSSIK